MNLCTSLTPEPDWENLRPVMDDALDELSEHDRAPVLWRFYKGRPFAEIGKKLSVSEDAARMRVERALEKLRAQLRRRGITSTTAALAVALGGQLGVAAPAGLAAKVVMIARGAEGAAAGGGWWSGPTFAMGAAALLIVGAVFYVAGLMRDNAAALAMAVAQRDASHAQTRALENRLSAEQTRARAVEADNGRLRAAIEAAANADAGRLAVDASRIAFVIDTSGSMRDPRNGGVVHAAVAVKLDEALTSDSRLQFFQVFDADGNYVMPDTAGKWLPINAATRAEAKRVLASYSRDTLSNAVPGIERALLALDAANDPTSRLVITVLGDELLGAPQAALNRMEELNPADAHGRRRVTINAVAFPTWLGLDDAQLRAQRPNVLPDGRVKTTAVPAPPGDPAPRGPATTHLRYERLMRALTGRHGGTYVALPSMQTP